MELLCVYIYRYISLTILSKEVEKLNFRQYGQMKSRAGQRQREEKVQKRKSQKKEDADARKGRKVAIHCVFPMICGSGGSKVGSLKRRVRRHMGRWDMKNCTPLWREAHFQVKMLKTLGVRTTFGGSEVEFRKSARRCGTKHISKSKCAKHQGFEPLLEAQRSSFEKVHAAVARSTFRSQNVQTTPCSDHFWRLRCRVSKKCTPWWREADLEVNMLKTLGFRTTLGGSDIASLNSTTLHDTTLCCTTLHYTTLHYTTLHNTTGYNYNYTTTVHYSPLH